MKAVIRPTAKKKVLLPISHLIIVMAQLVMHGHKVIRRRPETRLDADVELRIHVPCTGMTHHIAVARMRQHRALPEGLRKRVEADRLVEALAIADQLWRVRATRAQNRTQVIGHRLRRRRNDVTYVAP